MKLSFVRHGEHDGEGDSLTENGRAEMLAVRERIDFNETMITFYPPGVRFKESAEIIMGKRDSAYSRREMRALSYQRIDQKTPYYEGLINSIRRGRCLEYHFLHSDNHIRETGEYISSYTTMASFTSELLLKYIDIQSKLSERVTTDLHRVFCAREFIWASFRTKIIEIRYGHEAALQYVEWYSSTQEGVPDARKSIASISWDTSSGNPKVRISDVYGEEEVSINDLQELIRQEQGLLGGSPSS